MTKAIAKNAAKTATVKSDVKPAAVSANWISDMVTQSLKQVNMPVLNAVQIDTISNKLKNLYLIQPSKCTLLGCNKQALTQLLVMVNTALAKPNTSKAGYICLASAGVYYNDANLLVKQAINTGNVMYLDKAGIKKASDYQWLNSLSKQLTAKPDFIATVCKMYADNSDVKFADIVVSLSKLIASNKAIQAYSVITGTIKAIKTA